MSLRAFQACVARLIIDPDYRDRVRNVGAMAVDEDLTERERMRLCGIAFHPGLDINRTLHKGFRLGKLRAMLPLTCRLLGSARLAREASAFWTQHPPASFYFIPEAIEFCNFLAERRLRVKYLDEILAYERAMLETERADAPPSKARRIQFWHDPRILLAALAAGRRPRAVPRRPCIAECRKDSAGAVRWELFDGFFEPRFSSDYSHGAATQGVMVPVPRQSPTSAKAQ